MWTSYRSSKLNLAAGTDMNMKDTVSFYTNARFLFAVKNTMDIYHHVSLGKCSVSDKKYHKLRGFSTCQGLGAFLLKI